MRPGAVGFSRPRSDFDSLADEYARFRTSYSGELFDTIVEYAGPRRSLRALDLACGTGLSTKGLVARGFAVTGVDVAPGMLNAARISMPDAAFYQARAESLPFADGAFALVACGQAFHWFDAEAALAEIGRVLSPGGMVALFWKDALPDDPITKAADDLDHAWSGRHPSAMSAELFSNAPDMWSRSPFGVRDKRVFEVSLRFTVRSYVGYHSSRETLRLALGPRRDDYLRALGEMISAMVGGDGEFEVAAQEYLYLARRNGRA